MSMDTKERKEKERRIGTNSRIWHLIRSKKSGDDGSATHEKRMR